MALPGGFEHLSYPGLLALVFATGAGLPLPEDAVVLGAGWLVHRGAVAPVPTVLLMIAGVVAGDVFLYVVGRRFGRRVVEHPRFARRITPERLARAERFFGRWGAGAVVLARFVAGVRAGVYLTAGVLRMSFSRFLAVDIAASLVNVPLLVWLGYASGSGIDRVAAWVMRARLFALGAVVLAILAAWLLVRRRARSAAPREQQ